MHLSVMSSWPGIIDVRVFCWESCLGLHLFPKWSFYPESEFCGPGLWLHFKDFDKIKVTGCVHWEGLVSWWVDPEQAGPVWMSPPGLVTAAEWGREGLWQLLIWEVFGSRPLPEVSFPYTFSTYLYTDFHCFPTCALHTFLAL